MLISVVNLSKNIPDARAVEVLRAMNRQLREDFAPHWHVQAQARLEMDGKEALTRGVPMRLRGDAIVYLDDNPRSGGLEGYHTQNAQGVPFGVVYAQIAEDLDGTWTVALSHELLELAADPSLNRFAAGPHPVDRHRHVLHWLEVCDPVQDDCYKIDGVKVSSFVLPAYFDPSRRDLGRHDFLGGGGGKHVIAPFGIAPGGYVTFFDPDHKRNESVDADQEASRRRKIKDAHGHLRRTSRREAIGGHAKTKVTRLPAKRRG